LKRIHRACKGDVGDIKKREVSSKEKKVHVWKRRIRYLGFVVGKRQVKTDSGKVKAVSK
jgi:hypothetical protein